MRRHVEGYENSYEVTSSGEVLSLKRKVSKVLAPGKDKKGYLRVSLSEGGKAKTHKVHRLVAKAFIPNPDNLPQVNHIDEDKTNNHVSNLEWCTNKHNVTHSIYKQAKHYKFLSPLGKLVEVFNLSKFCRERKLRKSDMCQVHKGKAAHCKQWRKYGSTDI